MDSKELLKEASIKRIEQMQNGASFESIMYEINFIGQVIEGIEDAEQGRVVSTEQLLKSFPKSGRIVPEV